MPHVANHQGKASQNHNEVLPHTCENGYYQNKDKLQPLARMWRKITLVHSLWKYILVQPLWKTVGRLHKKLKIELPYDSSITLLGMYQTKAKRLIQKYACTPMFIAALFTIDKIWKQLKCAPTDE